MEYDLTALENKLQFLFSLHENCIDLPMVNHYFGSSDDCPGRALQITSIRFYGESTKIE